LRTTYPLAPSLAREGEMVWKGAKPPSRNTSPLSYEERGIKGRGKIN
jgi:hypothetical protein